MKVPESVRGWPVQIVSGEWSAASLAAPLVAARPDEPFYIMDLGQVLARYQRWTQLMPRVEPFYAVKCNDDKVLVRALAALGAGFDCASKAELELVTSLGVEPHRIIFANPAKLSSHIRRADALGVCTMTFDSEFELHKIKQLMPHAQLVIRIRCEAAAAQCPLGMKFGCDPVTEAPRLLKLAAVHGLDVIGVSFHVGSGAGEAGVYARAIRASAALAAAGRRLALRMELLDVGGGFPGAARADILEVSQVINSALDTYFPEKSVRVIAEPGRYFAAAAYTLVTTIHSIREIEPAEGGEKHTMYFINDGVYGSFNCILYDHQQVTVQPLKNTGGPLINCSIWGPSCDGLDCVLPAGRLPAQAAGGALLWPDMGAYTLPVASPFNGFPVPTVHYFVDRAIWGELQELVPAWGVAVEEGGEQPPSPPPSPAAAPSPSASPSPSPPPPPAHAALFIECALK